MTDHIVENLLLCCYLTHATFGHSLPLAAAIVDCSLPLAVAIRSSLETELDDDAAAIFCRLRGGDEPPALAFRGQLPTKKYVNIRAAAIGSQPTAGKNQPTCVYPISRRRPKYEVRNQRPARINQRNGATKWLRAPIGFRRLGFYSIIARIRFMH